MTKYNFLTDYENEMLYNEGSLYLYKMYIHGRYDKMSDAMRVVFDKFSDNYSNGYSEEAIFDIMDDIELKRLNKTQENEKQTKIKKSEHLKTILNIVVVVSWLIGVLLSILTFSDKFYLLGILSSYSMLIPAGYGATIALFELKKKK